MKKFTAADVGLLISITVFIVFGNVDKIFNVMIIEEPFPKPFSVIKSDNQRTIIDPVIKVIII